MILLFFACTPDTYLPKRDSSQEWSVFEAVQPKWDTEEILTSYEELLSYGIPNGHHVWLLYKELYDEGATPNCPGTEYNFNSVELTGYDCYTSDGYQFEGLSDYERWSDGYRIHLEGRIVAPDGRSLIGAGSVRTQEFVDPNNAAPRQVLRLEGSFYSNFGQNWLDQAFSSFFQIEKFYNGFRLDGGYTINGTALYFKNLEFVSCEEGFGDLWLRDPSGGWWMYVPQENCSGKGELYFNETNTGIFEWDLKPLAEMIRELEQE